MYKWNRRVKRGEPYYECSSKGDKRFSAIFAKIDNKSIEEIYQLDIKGYRGEVEHWKDAKGKEPKNITYEEAYEQYLNLWIKYFNNNPELYFEIREKAKDKTITDMFGITPINQARAICDILNNPERLSIFKENYMSKFLNKSHDYKNNIDPIEQYIKVSSVYISKKKNIPIEEAEQKIRDYIKTNKRYKNPKVKYRERNLKGDTEIKVTNLNSYIQYPKRTGNIIVPSFTVYFKPELKKSLHSEFIYENVAERNMHKKLAFKYENEGKIDLFKKHNTIQKTKKIFNNSLSGAYGSSGTILFNPSAHYTLTSITRCVSGTGNSLSETVISGNKHFASPDIVLNYISTVVTYTDKDKINKIKNKYNLHTPTIDELMDMVLKSTRYYWKSAVKEKYIYDLLSTLTSEERLWLMYLNDLWHMRKYNENVLRDLFNMLLKRPNIDNINLPKDEMVEILNNHKEYLNMLHHIRADVLQGKNPVYGLLDENDVKELYGSLMAAKEAFEKYDDLLTTFLITDLLPINISYIRDMLREVIVLSDTDSTCATYEDWVIWYYGENKFSIEGMAATGVIMTLATTSIDHGIKVFAANMNIPKDRVNLIAMKNEFYWDVFVNTNVSKHYFADFWIKEGNVRVKPKNEIKGVNLIASNVYNYVRDIRLWMMNDIFKQVRNKQPIPIETYLKITLAVESLIIQKVMEGSPSILKMDKIKGEDSYKLDKYKSPYFHYLVWQAVFAKKYDNAPDPMYIAVKTPVTTNNKRKINEFIEVLKQQDEEMAKGFEVLLKDANKTAIGSLKLPLANLLEKGLPEELTLILDLDKIIFDNCNVLYMVLESIGYHKLPKTTLSDIELSLLEEIKIKSNEKYEEYISNIINK